MDFVGFYPNIPNGEGLVSVHTFLKTRYSKQIPGDALTKLAKVVLKINIFEFDEKNFKQKRGAK